MSLRRHFSTVVKSTAVLISAALFSVLTFLPSTATATAGINNSLNYQGRLLTSSGAIAPDGFYNMEFKIYQDGTGCVTSGTSPCGGTLKYTEDWVYGTGSPDNRVKVTNGYFSVQIGTINTTLASSVDWNQNTLWMSVNIGSTSTAANFAAASGDGEMLPFKRLTAAPYALNAATANNALLLQGLTYNQFARVDTGNTFNGNQLFKADPTPSQTAFQFQPSAGGTPILDISTTNNSVGIGTATPGFALDVIGDIRASGNLRAGAAQALMFGGSSVCTAAGCTDLLTFTGNGLFSRGTGATANTITGVTCTSNGQTLVWNAGSWGCGTGSGGAAGTTTVSSVIDTSAYSSAYSNNPVSQVVDNNNQSHVTYTDSSGYNNTGKEATCSSSGCGAAAISNVRPPSDTKCSPRVMDSALGSDGFPRFLAACSSGVAPSSIAAGTVRYIVCLNAQCTSSHASIIDNGNTSYGTYQHEAGSFVLDSSGFARIILSASSVGAEYVKCANDLCTSFSSSSLKSLDPTYANNIYSLGATIALSPVGSPGTGYPIIGYFVSGSTTYRYRLARCANDACTSASSVVDIDTSLQAGGNDYSSSMYIDPTDKQPRIAYTTPLYANNIVTVKCTAAAGDCSTKTTASVQITGGNTHYDVVMKYNPTVTGSGHADIAFYMINSTVDLVVCSADPCSASAVTTSITGFSNTNSAYYSTSLAVPSGGGAPVFAGASSTVGVRVCNNAACTSPNGVASYSGGSGNSYTAGLMLDGSSNPRVFSYFDGGTTVDSYLDMASCNSTCGTITHYSVDGSPYYISGGLNLSMAMGTDGLPRVAIGAPLFRNVTASGSPYAGFVMIAECQTLSCNQYNYLITSSFTCTTGTNCNSGYANQLVGPGSLQIDSSGYYRLAYNDINTGNVKYLQCLNATCSGGSSPVNIDSTTVGLTNSNYPAMLLGGSGSTPMIAYNNGSALKYALCSSAACSSPTLSTLDSSSFAITPAMALNSGNPSIAYYDSANNYLKLINCTSTACSNSAITVDSSAQVGSSPSIIVSSGNAIISYIDKTNHNVKIASCNNSSCSAPGFITIAANSPSYAALAMDSFGYLRVAYVDNLAGCTSYSTAPANCTYGTQS